MRSGIELITWQDARDSVLTLNPALAKAIDRVDPGKAYPLLRLKYRFGEYIIRNGAFQFPQASSYSPQDRASKALLEHAQAYVDYSTIPLFLTCQNMVEVFLQTRARVIPLNSFYEGSILGLFELLNAQYNLNPITNGPWNVTAGSRSLFLLPKISNAASLHNLNKHYRLEASINPTCFTKQWELFVALVKQSATETPWESTILVFSKPWFEENAKQGNSVFENISHTLFCEAWKQADFAISSVNISLILEKFSSLIETKHLKPRLYLIDHIKHIISILTGKSPGFCKVDDSNKAAPTCLLKKIFLEQYGLKNHVPDFMHSAPLNTIFNPNQPLYYSLSHPTLLTGSAKSKETYSVMENLQSIQSLLKLFFDTLSPNDPFLNKAAVNFFHTRDNPAYCIQSSEQIPETDPTFKENFCETSRFWRGCIQMRQSVEQHTTDAKDQDTLCFSPSEKCA